MDYMRNRNVKKDRNQKEDKEVEWEAEYYFFPILDLS